MQPQTSNRQPTSSAAIVALILSVSGYFCLWGVGGFLAVALGFVALARINSHQSSESGRGIALTAIALGAVNLIATGGLTIWALSGHDSGDAAKVQPPRKRAPARAPGGLGATPSAHPGPAAPPPKLNKTVDAKPFRIAVGEVELVDIPDSSIPLARALKTEAARALRERKSHLLVWVSSPNCEPCNGVAVALVEPAMQRALSKFTVARLNVHAHELALRDMGIPTDRIPGFALLDGDLKTTDYMDGGEWDEDIAENIAPVLHGFVRGRLRERRKAWRGPRRSEETPL